MSLLSSENFDVHFCPLSTYRLFFSLLLVTFMFFFESSFLCVCMHQFVYMFVEYFILIVQVDCQNFTASLLGKEAEASPSIGNTLWHISTMFTRSAITPPEVNGFG